MAYTKKDGGATTTKSATKVVEKKDNTEIEALKAEFAALRAQNDLLVKLLQQGGIAATPTIQAPTSLVQEATLVHLVQLAPGLSTHIELSNTTIDMNAFGEERVLDRRQCEEIAGKYICLSR